MTTQPGPMASDGDANEDESTDIADAFAGLTAIDIIDGELVPRRDRSRP